MGNGITSNDVTIGVKKGATWGTAVDITSTNAFKLRASVFSPDATFNEILSSDIGFAKKIVDTLRGQLSATISITMDMTFNQPWLALLASVLGTESSATETTPSQGDYSRTIDLADSTYGSSACFWTMAMSTENATGAKLIELPSVKLNTVRMDFPVNDKPTITFTGIIDRIVISSWTTTYAHLIGLSATGNYETAVFTGTNAYYRQNAFSGGALSSGDNQAIESVSLELSRPSETRYGLRGANSQYTMEPYELGQIQGSVTVKYSEIDSSIQNLLDHWLNKTAQKAEWFLDGAQIGSGVNASYKFQIPEMAAMPKLPDGYKVPNNTSLMKPEIQYRMLQAAAAPTGMTGVTEYIRVTSIDRRSTKWTA